MAKLTVKEQILLAFYALNFQEDKDVPIKELTDILDRDVDDASQLIGELEGKGLVGYIEGDDKQSITNEGIIYIDNILHVHSEATERNKLTYVKNSLLINEIELSVLQLRKYINKYVGIKDVTS